MTYTCKNCDATVDEAQVLTGEDIKSLTLLDRYIITEDPDSKWHMRWFAVGAGRSLIGCHMEQKICGPLHVETDQEYFVRWAVGDDQRG